MHAARTARRVAQLGLVVLAATACASGGAATRAGSRGGTAIVDHVNTQMVVIPSTLLARGENLAAAKLGYRGNEAALQPAIRAVLDSAQAALAMRPLAVTQKQRTPPSGDKHDFMSMAPYWWPDTTKPDGLPFVRRDGVVYPESRVDHDGVRLQRTIFAVEALAYAYYLTDEERYAARAAELLRIFFLDPATRMNPHLRFAQAVLGVNEGRGIGIIDTRHMPQLVDALALLQGTEHWTEADRDGMRAWIRAYLDWLLTSTHGSDERKEENNHGTFYDEQVLALALHVGDTAVARETVERTKGRIAAQLDAEGKQPLELARTRPLHYSLFNLDAFTMVAELARHTGADLWKHRAPNGASLGAALRYLAPYAGGRTSFPKPDVGTVGTDVWVEPFRRGAAVLGDSVLVDALRALPAPYMSVHRSRLAFPELP